MADMNGLWKKLLSPLGLVALGLIIAFHTQALGVFGWSVQLVSPAIGAVLVVVGAVWMFFKRKGGKKEY